MTPENKRKENGNTHNILKGLDSLSETQKIKVTPPLNTDVDKIIKSQKSSFLNKNQTNDWQFVQQGIDNVYKQQEEKLRQQKEQEEKLRQQKEQEEKLRQQKEQEEKLRQKEADDFAVQVAKNEFYPLLKDLKENVSIIQSAKESLVFSFPKTYLLDKTIIELSLVWGKVGLDKSTINELKKYLEQLKDVSEKKEKMKRSIREKHKYLETPDFNRDEIVAFNYSFLPIRIIPNSGYPKDPEVELAKTKTSYQNYLKNKQAYLAKLGEYILDPDTVQITINPNKRESGSYDDSMTKIRELEDIPGIIFSSRGYKNIPLNFYHCDDSGYNCYTEMCMCAT